MSAYVTRFGSMADYDKGGVEIIDDDPKNYVFSNIFEVCSKAQPYERTAVGKNFEYVVEAARAEGTSGWFAAAHDEFVLCLDGEVEVHLVKPDRPQVEPDSRGAHALAEAPDGRKMARMILNRGHLGLLPGGSAYRFEAAAPAAMLFQTIEGPLTLQRWAEICQVK